MGKKNPLSLIILLNWTRILVMSLTNKVYDKVLLFYSQANKKIDNIKRQY